jgi:hypothetical protein
MDITSVLDNYAGKAQHSQGESLSTFLASLTTSTAILAIGIALYTLLKSRVPEV